MVDYKYLKTRQEGSVFIIELSRPKSRNAWTESMRSELCGALGGASRDASVKAVVLTGDPAGRAFCAGADLSGGGGSIGKDLAAEGSTGDVPKGRRTDQGTFRDGGGVAALAVLHCTKPVIAAMNGPAVGVGLTLACACDMRVVAHDAKVGFVFVRRGLACESVSSWVLPKLVGMGSAMELVMTGRVFRSQEAPPGLFNYVVDEAEVMPKAMALALEIADNASPMSVALSRFALLRNGSLSPEEAHLVESRIIYFTSNGADATEGVNSFLEKRPPNFKLDPYKDLPDFYPWWPQVSTSNL